MEGVFREPSVSLHSVELAGISLKGVDLVCRVNVENPNPVTIPFPEIGWELFINTGSFLSGMVKNGEPVRARGVTVLNVPVSLSYTEFLDTFKSFRGRKDADYHLALETRFLLPVLGAWVRHFDYQGKFPLVQMISFRNPSFRVEKLDFGGADIHCSVDIDNPNPFPIPFPGMEYHYAVRNNGFVTGTVEAAGPLAAAALNPVNIRLRVVYSDLYRSFPSLETVGEAASLLSLSSLIVLPGFGEARLSLDIPGSLPLLKVPVLSFRGISVKNISLSKIDLEFGWDVENGNGFVFEVENLEYQLLVNNDTWAQGRAAEKMGLAPGRTAAIPVTVSISSPALVKDLTDIITRGMDVAYDLKGSVTFNSNLGAFAGQGLPFSFTGRTRLRR
jgi:LEA14-like dessication related protein